MKARMAIPAAAKRRSPFSGLRLLATVAVVAILDPCAAVRRAWAPSKEVQSVGADRWGLVHRVGSASSVGSASAPGRGTAGILRRSGAKLASDQLRQAPSATMEDALQTPSLGMPPRKVTWAGDVPGSALENRLAEILAQRGADDAWRRERARAKCYDSLTASAVAALSTSVLPEAIATVGLCWNYAKARLLDRADRLIFLSLQPPAAYKAIAERLHSKERQDFPTIGPCDTLGNQDDLAWHEQSVAVAARSLAECLPELFAALAEFEAPKLVVQGVPGKRAKLVEAVLSIAELVPAAADHLLSAGFLQDVRLLSEACSLWAPKFCIAIASDRRAKPGVRLDAASKLMSFYEASNCQDEGSTAPWLRQDCDAIQEVVLSFCLLHAEFIGACNQWISMFPQSAVDDQRQQLRISGAFAEEPTIGEHDLEIPTLMDIRQIGSMAGQEAIEQAGHQMLRSVADAAPPDVGVRAHGHERHQDEALGEIDSLLALGFDFDMVSEAHPFAWDTP
mmetsp:Transcript_64576/g.185686  ORF Transcript_64576/g.185686 Transcript_64576/m.185686 type:complete len:508 (+) Transcript_64576:39-1562(+)